MIALCRFSTEHLFEQFLCLRPHVHGGFRGTEQAWEPGQQWRGVLCRASPWVFTGGLFCLDWWFRMFPGSECTIIHWSRGQQWILSARSSQFTDDARRPTPTLSVTPPAAQDHSTTGNIGNGIIILFSTAEFSTEHLYFHKTTACLVILTWLDLERDSKTCCPDSALMS